MSRSRGFWEGQAARAKTLGDRQIGFHWIHPFLSFPGTILPDQGQVLSLLILLPAYTRQECSCPFLYDALTMFTQGVYVVETQGHSHARWCPRAGAPWPSSDLITNPKVTRSAAGRPPLICLWSWFLFMKLFNFSPLYSSFLIL